MFVLLSCSRDLSVPPTGRGVTGLGVVGLSPRQVMQVKVAADGWNEGIAREVFRIDQPARVKVIFSNAYSPAARTRSLTADCVYVDPTLQDEEIVAALYHELGHVLGFPHSDCLSSIMYPDLEAYFRPRPTDEDFLRTRAIAR